MRECVDAWATYPRQAVLFRLQFAGGQRAPGFKKTHVLPQGHTAGAQAKLLRTVLGVLTNLSRGVGVSTEVGPPNHVLFTCG